MGSGPGSLENAPGFVDGHDVVVRVNNYRLLPPTGFRTDVFYSFFGPSIRKSAEELRNDGVTLCMSKCPDARAFEACWQNCRDRMQSVDYRWICRNRTDWSFCDTYVPSVETFAAKVDLLDGHIPTTGFAAILDVLGFGPSSLYLTGFDFFRSRLHNVDEPWREGNRNDPIRHLPETELAWLAANLSELPTTCDPMLLQAITSLRKAIP